MCKLDTRGVAPRISTLPPCTSGCARQPLAMPIPCCVCYQTAHKPYPHHTGSVQTSGPFPATWQQNSQPVGPMGHTYLQATCWVFLGYGLDSPDLSCMQQENQDMKGEGGKDKLLVMVVSVSYKLEVITVQTNTRSE